MKYKNLTPHSIAVYSQGPIPVAVLEPERTTARVEMGHTYKEAREIAGYKVSIYQNIPLQIRGLPEPEEDTTYIVSRLVAESLPERSDLLYPNDLVRENGIVVGCRSFGQAQAQQGQVTMRESAKDLYLGRSQKDEASEQKIDTGASLQRV